MDLKKGGSWIFKSRKGEWELKEIIKPRTLQYQNINDSISLTYKTEDIFFSFAFFNGKLKRPLFFGAYFPQEGKLAYFRKACVLSYLLRRKLRSLFFGAYFPQEAKKYGDVVHLVECAIPNRKK